MIARYLSVCSCICLFALTGCTSNVHNVIDTARYVSDLDRAVDPDYIRSVPYASTIVTINDEHPLLLILARSEYLPSTQSYRLTWLSEDYGSIVTEGGRIVHTTGFLNDNLEALDAVPASAYTLPGAQATWQARYDWSPGYRYGFTAEVSSQSLGQATVATGLWRQTTEQVRETVNFKGLDVQLENLYWTVPANDTHQAFVVKSLQYLGPNMDRVEMVMVRPFVPPQASTSTLAKEAQ